MREKSLDAVASKGYLKCEKIWSGLLGLARFMKLPEGLRGLHIRDLCKYRTERLSSLFVKQIEGLLEAHTIFTQGNSPIRQGTTQEDSSCLEWWNGHRISFKKGRLPRMGIILQGRYLGSAICMHVMAPGRSRHGSRKQRREVGKSHLPPNDIFMICDFCPHYSGICGCKERSWFPIVGVGGQVLFH